MKKKKFRHLSLFSGYGGMDIDINGNFEVIGNYIGSKKNGLKFQKLNSILFLQMILRTPLEFFGNKT